MGNVGDMRWMFQYASSFNQQLCWDLSHHNDDDYSKTYNYYYYNFTFRVENNTQDMFVGSNGSIGCDLSPTPAPATSPAPAPTAAKLSDDGPDDGALQEIGDAVVDFWSATKTLFKHIWSSVF